MKKLIAVLFLTLVQFTTSAQYHLSGTVRDKQSHETLAGVNISFSETKTSLSTNNYGFFSLKLPQGSHQISFSYVGYKTVIKEITLTADLEITIEMDLQNINLKEVEITAKDERFLQSNNFGLNKIDVKSIKSLPSLGGVSDIFKSIQLLPGINTTVDGNSSIFVRGGSSDQNLILLDNAPIYNPAHCLGFFSVFNTDALKSFDIYKSGFPSRFGGRLSSVIDITMKEGNMKKYSGILDLGLISSSFSFEGPVQKEKSSFFISGRYSYAGFTYNNFGKLGEKLGIRDLRNFNDNNDISFWDIYFKNNYKINKNNHLYLSFYSGRDQFYLHDLSSQNNLNWGNIATSVRLTHIFNTSLFMNSIVYGSKYNYQQSDNNGFNQYQWTASIYELGTKHSFDWYLNLKNKIQSGFDLNYQRFSPGTIIWGDSSFSKETSLNNKNALTAAVYFSDEYQLNKFLKFDVGLRINSYSTIGRDITYVFDENNEFVIDSIYTAKGTIAKTYWSIEPRICVNIFLTSSQILIFNYSRTSQNLHLLKSSSIGLPTDVWIPSDKNISPQKCNIYAIAYHSQMSKKLKASLEFYHKDYFDIIDFKDNADLKMNPLVETQILKGEGKSNGMEILFEKQGDRLSGWIGYSFSETKNKIPTINSGEYFNAPQNITHSFTLALSYQLSEKWFITSDFKYSSGAYITVPDGSYFINNTWMYHYTQRNSYKLPDYHRLDVAIKYVKQSKIFRNEFYLSIYNVYNNTNPYYVDIPRNRGAYNYESSKAYYLYLFGLLPTIGCSFKF